MKNYFYTYHPERLRTSYGD
jgi:hypothetical protein